MLKRERERERERETEKKKKERKKHIVTLDLLLKTTTPFFLAYRT